MRPRVSLRGSVRPSVGRSVGDAFVKGRETHYFQAYTVHSVETDKLDEAVNRELNVTRS